MNKSRTEAAPRDPAAATPRSAIAEELNARLLARSAQMKSHPVFSHLHSLSQLRLFMGWHVFAVWDFMSLVKRLQREFTTMALPWVPPARPAAARLMNEIVLGEETDDTPAGTHLSHFELYVQAMAEVRAPTLQIEHFVALVRARVQVETALRIVEAPAAVATFVQATLATAQNGTVLQALGSFLHGREEAIPDMFRSLLSECAVPPAQTPTFVHYLERHVELDGDSHGPGAERLAEDLVRGQEQPRRELLEAGCLALDQRIALWDALELELQRGARSD